MVKDGEMVKIGLKWSQLLKIVKNGRPDLKRARRTGLSARRTRRTKSRGPKGLQLEVGARRAPRLLYTIFTYQNKLNLEWIEDFLKVEGEGFAITSTSRCPLHSVMVVVVHI